MTAPFLTVIKAGILAGISSLVSILRDNLCLLKRSNDESFQEQAEVEAEKEAEKQKERTYYLKL